MVRDNTTAKRYSAGELARRFGLVLAGDDTAWVDGACALSPGRSGGLAFADDPRHETALAASAASVIVAPGTMARAAPAAALISDTPRLSFARIAALFEAPAPTPGVATSAVVDSSAEVASGVHVGAQATIGARSRIGPDTAIGAGAIIGDDVIIGAHGVIGPRAVVLANSRIGARARVGAGAVIGERGFGLVSGPAGYEPVPQLGGVCLEDDVEIGANSTIDRGALDDTIVRAGVKIDNQVHIAHNCVIGGHTVIAGCTGIAGSCVIGARCMIGGGVGIGDHVTIADDVMLTAASQVPRDIREQGVYSSTLRVMPARRWRKRLALFRALDRIETRLSRVETSTREKTNKMSGDF